MIFPAAVTVSGRKRMCFCHSTMTQHACTAEGWVFGRRTKILGGLSLGSVPSVWFLPLSGNRANARPPTQDQVSNRGRARRKTSCSLEGWVTKFVVVGSFNQPWRRMGDTHAHTTAFSRGLYMPPQPLETMRSVRHTSTEPAQRHFCLLHGPVPRPGIAVQ